MGKKNILTKELLLKSVAEWNIARLANPDDIPYLTGVDLSGADLSGADLSETDISDANLSGTDLRGALLNETDLSRANLSGANLSTTDLISTNLSGADLSETDLSDADLSGLDLSGADLSGADLSGVDLSSADLSGADLSNALLYGANLSDADLSGADIYWADFSMANLCGANFKGALSQCADFRDANLSETDLRDADLGEANFIRSFLSGANLSGARVGYTTFGDVDLSGVIGLETVRHQGPSTLGVDTIYASNGNIPEVFLRSCGVPDKFIENICLLKPKASDYHSCFISHSTADKVFVDRFYGKLQEKGVRCYYAPHDLPIGVKTRPTIHEEIRKYDKLLLVLSEHSVKSAWVEDEVEHAFELEKERGKLVLFPIRLDDAVMVSKTGWASSVKSQRNIGDFTKWKEGDAYNTAFERLLKGLKQSQSDSQ